MVMLILNLMTITGVAVCAIGDGSATPVSPFVADSFDEACATAQRQDKLVLVYLSEPNNTQCDGYRNTTWTDPDLREWMASHVVAIEADAARHQPIHELLDARFIPTVVVMTPNGRVRSRIIGYREPERLLKELKEEIESSDGVLMARRRLESDIGSVVARLAFARSLEEADRPADALEEYVRCFRRSNENRSGFGGDRLLVIEEMRRMSEHFEPAESALQGFRNDARQRLLRGVAERFDPAVFAAANTALSAMDDTVEVYSRLRKSAPNGLPTRLLRECLIDSLLSQRRYELIDSLIELSRQVEQAHERYQRDLQRPVPAGVDSESFRDFERRSFINGSARTYEMLVGLERHEEAAQLAQTLVDVHDSASTHAVLARSALRAGKPGEQTLQHARLAVSMTDPLNYETAALLVRVLLKMDRRTQADQTANQLAHRLADDKDRDMLKRLATGRSEDAEERSTPPTNVD